MTFNVVKIDGVFQYPRQKSQSGFFIWHQLETAKICFFKGFLSAHERKKPRCLDKSWGAFKRQHSINEKIGQLIRIFFPILVGILETGYQYRSSHTWHSCYLIASREKFDTDVIENNFTKWTFMTRAVKMSPGIQNTIWNHCSLSFHLYLRTQNLHDFAAQILLLTDFQAKERLLAV